MSFELMKLPYGEKDLEPCISSETIGYHYGKHHQTYVNNLNNLIKGTEFEKLTLEEIIKKSKKDSEIAIFNNSAQIWNHDFYWNSLSPKNNNINDYEEVKNAISQGFGNIDNFINEFTEKSAKAFGSSWSWLVYADNSFKITTTSNADNPLIYDQTPIFTLDLWEHSYYIDYRNKRPEYIKSFLENLINWEFIYKNLQKIKK